MRIVLKNLHFLIKLIDFETLYIHIIDLIDMTFIKFKMNNIEMDCFEKQVKYFFSQVN